MASIECVFTSDSAGQLWNTCAWDIVTGSVLMQYKGGTSAARTLCTVGCDYLISAQPDKPLVRAWSLQRKDQLQNHIVCPGKVSALAASPDGAYCIAGIDEKIFIWQVSSGDLLAVLSLHFQAITCLRFSDDGCHFVSASRDGQVIAWDLAAALAPRLVGASAPEPLHVWSQHTYDVTDLYVGLGGVRARVVSCSLDQTCRVYELHSGDVVFTSVLDSSLTSVVADPAESHVFAGSLEGVIYEVALYSGGVQNGKEGTFAGHEGRVTCLSVSVDGHLLVSGSEDRTARIWDVPSKQCLQVLQHRGTVTNAFVAPTPVHFHSSPGKPVVPLAPFKRTVCAADGGLSVVNLAEALRDGDRVDGKDGFDRNGFLLTLTELGENEDDVDRAAEEGSERAEGPTKEELRREVARLKQVNQQLYDFAANCIVAGRREAAVDEPA